MDKARYSSDIQEWVLGRLEETHHLFGVVLLTLGRLYQHCSHWIDEQLAGYQPSHVIFGTLFMIYLARRIWAFWRYLSWAKTLRFIRSLPIIRTIVRKQLDKIGSNIRKELSDVYGEEPYLELLPKKPQSSAILLRKLKHYQLFDTAAWTEGRISGAIYGSNGAEYNSFLCSIYGSTMWSNPLHADVFASIRKMESEIIRMVASMFKGDPNRVIGSVTSGGTESIIMACKAYRDFAINVRGIEGQPEIIVPTTAHAAFEKGANMLGCKIIKIPINSETLKVNVRLMRRAINGNTCMLVGSAPNFPHGIIDSIEQIGKLGLKYRIPVHVDACLGGFLIAFMEEANHPLDERFDFRVPGVTSISVDTHKYGYAPKGTSVILYKEKCFIHQQYSIQTDWPGGLYASPTLPGSRPGGLIATCWAALQYHGLEGYLEATDKIIRTSRWIIEQLASIEGIEVMGKPNVSVVAFKSSKFSIYKLNDHLKECGWNLNVLQYPGAIHLCVTLMHSHGKVASNFVRDINNGSKKLTEETRQKSTANKKDNDSGSAAIYGMAQTIPDRSIVAEVCTSYLDACLGY